MEFSPEEEFFLVASHELRTPVTALKLQLDLAKKILKSDRSKGFTPEQMVQFLNRSSKDLESLSHLIEELLDASSIEQMRLPLTPEYAIVDEFLWDLCAKMSARLNTLNVTFNSKIHAPVLARWDLQQIQRLLNYIVNNGILRKASSIHLDVVTGGGHVYIQIKDNGDPISKEQERTIFKKRFNRSSRKGVGSLGLGTFLAKEITELHKGKISTTSSPDETIFTVSLPTHP